ncbi:MAG: bifunctional glutamate N-acetyltransferase/amino-acid acetyltransferase ArgJ [Patescibacteria group bacterium]
MKILTDGLSSVDGFLYLGKHVGIKRQKKDLGILYCEKVCSAAAVYTKNQIKGASLYVTKDHLENGQAQAVVVNSGVANVATGQQGIKNAELLAEAVAKELNIQAADVLVASTGVIGPQLPMDKITAGIKGTKAELSKTGDFAEAIMTTDTFKKEICVEHENFRIAATAKGSGMLAPNMATMLAFVVTDAEVPADELNAMLKVSVNKSLNMLSIDMDTSTSDTVMILSSGTAKDVKPERFQEALDKVCVEITKMLAVDGEGATKLIISQTVNAASPADAKKVAKSIVNSNLVKCAVFGNDPNWGRIMMALGNSQAETLVEDKIKVWINDKPIVDGGKAADGFDEPQLTEILKNNKEIYIKIDLGLGESEATAYGCDMTYDYIKINAEYTT